MNKLLSIGIILFVCGCSSKPKATSEMEKKETPLSFLALGDSYTIGESVEASERWPVQLAKSLTDSGIIVANPRIIATTGWTTDELMGAIKEANINQTYDLVSLLIGVNNQYRGYPFSNYEKEFEELLTTAIKFANNQHNSVFVVSIPDYGVTPFGQKKEPSKIASELDNYNAKAKEICETKGVTFINITDISKNALTDSTLVAEDQLHPSARMYSLWTERIFREVKRSLQ